MSRKPTFVAQRDRGDLDIDLPEDVPDTGFTVDLDNDDPDAFEIVEQDDTPEDDRGKPTEIDDELEVSEEELRGLSRRTQDRIKRLTFERETNRRRAEQAERDGQAALEAGRRMQADNDRLRTSVKTTSETLATTMITEREGKLAAARKALADAHDASDGEAIAKATEEISTLSTELTLIKAQRQPANKEEVKNDDPNRQTQQQERAPAPLDPDVVGWLSENRWFNKPGNEEKTAIAMAAHHRLVSNGIKPGDPRYLEGLDESLKRMFPEHKVSTKNVPTREKEPSGRGDVVNGGQRRTTPANSDPRKVVLTPSEIRTARNLGVSLQAYAAQKVKFNAGKGGAR